MKRVVTSLGIEYSHNVTVVKARRETNESERDVAVMKPRITVLIRRADQKRGGGGGKG